MNNFNTLESLHKKFGSRKKNVSYKPDTSQRHPLIHGKYAKDAHGIKDSALKSKMK